MPVQSVPSQTPDERGWSTEHLSAQAVGAGVYPADEGLHAAAGDALDRLAEFRGGGVLEEHPRLSQPFVLGGLDEVALGGRESFFERADERVRSGPVRPRPHRSAPNRSL